MLEVFAEKWIKTKNLHYLFRDGKMALKYDKRRLRIYNGESPWPGYMNIAPTEGQGVDLVRDVAKGLPFDGNTASEVHVEGVLHLYDSDAAWYTLLECWRVLQPGAMVHVMVPAGVSGDPGQKMFWTKETMGKLLGPIPLKIVETDEKEGWLGFSLEREA